MKDIGVIAVKRKEVGIAKSGIDVSQTKVMQKEMEGEIRFNPTQLPLIKTIENFYSNGSTLYYPKTQHSKD